MRTIKTTAGTPVDLDGDVLAVIETVSRDLVRTRELDYGFEDVQREFDHLIGQMSEADLRTYLRESLFMSFNRFENERMMALVSRIENEDTGKNEDTEKS
jgi:phage gp29-like protein